MKKTLLILLFLNVSTFYVKAQSWYYHNSTNTKKSTSTYQYNDFFKNSYKSYENLWKDSDKDGYLNYYDRHDKNPNVGFYQAPTFSYPSYYDNYKSSTFDFNSGRTIYEGPRGGQYYINSNGNKTYISNPFDW